MPILDENNPDKKADSHPLLNFMEQYDASPSSKDAKQASYRGFARIVDLLAVDQDAENHRDFTALNWYFEQFNYGKNNNSMATFLDEMYILRGNDVLFNQTLEDFLSTRKEYEKFNAWMEDDGAMNLDALTDLVRNSESIDIDEDLSTISSEDLIDLVIHNLQQKPNTTTIQRTSKRYSGENNKNTQQTPSKNINRKRITEFFNFCKYQGVQNLNDIKIAYLKTKNGDVDKNVIYLLTDIIGHDKEGKEIHEAVVAPIRDSYAIYVMTYYDDGVNGPDKTFSNQHDISRSMGPGFTVIPGVCASARVRRPRNCDNPEREQYTRLGKWITRNGKQVLVNYGVLGALQEILNRI